LRIAISGRSIRLDLLRGLGFVSLWILMLGEEQARFIAAARKPRTTREKLKRTRGHRVTDT
jgi:hypothetical protein